MRADSHSERGVALITVMLVFAVSAIIAVAMVSRQQIDIVRTANMLEQIQAKEYALGAEELAKQTLLTDAQLTPGIDYPGQHWASLRDGMPIEQGSVTLQIEDLQARFNLNNLIGNTVAPAAYLQKLLTLIGIQTDINSLIASLITIASSTGGNLGNQAAVLGSVTLLRDIADLSADDYRRLLPFVAALPTHSSALNINTAPDILLRATVPDDHIYQLIVKLRTTQGYVTQDQLQSIGNTMGMTVRSDYFGVTTRVTYRERTLTLYSVLHRINGGSKINVLSREIINF